MPAHQPIDKAKQNDSNIQKEKHPPSQEMASQSQYLDPSALQQAAQNPRAARPETILQLQRLYGNRAVGQMIATADKRAADARPVQLDQSPPAIQRMTIMDAKKLVSEKWPKKMSKEAVQKYRDLYAEWFQAQGDQLAQALKPLNERSFKKTLDDWAKYPALVRKRLAFMGQYQQSIVLFDLLVGINLESSASAQLQSLLDNFKNRIGTKHFEYTMSSTGSDKFLKGKKEGDCNTLVRTFKLIAEEFLGINVEYKTSSDIGFTGRFTAPGKATIDGKTGNVDNGSFWLFDNHYWIVYQGTIYDVLFGVVGLDTGSWVKETGKSDNPSIFGDKQIWATGKAWPIAGRYQTTPPPKPESPVEKPSSETKPPSEK
jgi:hypothetical protein